MGFGIFLICVIMLVFSVTHVLKFDCDITCAELAGELALILLGGFCLYLGLYLMRGLL